MLSKPAMLWTSIGVGSMVLVTLLGGCTITPYVPPERVHERVVERPSPSVVVEQPRERPQPPAVIYSPYPGY